jgi:hypothetical protein
MIPVDLSLLAQDPEPMAVIIAKDQPEYDPLPALIYTDGRVLTEWSLTEEERGRLIAGERIRLWVWTFNHPLQPLQIEVTDEHRP